MKIKISKIVTVDIDKANESGVKNIAHYVFHRLTERSEVDGMLEVTANIEDMPMIPEGMMMIDPYMTHGFPPGAPRRMHNLLDEMKKQILLPTSAIAKVMRCNDTQKLTQELKDTMHTVIHSLKAEYVRFNLP